MPLPLFFYNIFIFFYPAGVWMASLINPKAKKWIEGRKNIFHKLSVAIEPGHQVIWIHCASLGEFEQGSPLIEALRERFPGHKILLTFFSPSGYQAKKDYPGADWVFYLPMDGPRRAKRFLEIVHPAMAIFVKYEFWYYYLKKIRYRNIPLILVSALFRPDMSFFKWYGGLQQKMLARFDQLFVQNQSSSQLLENIGLGKITTISGDTRFDRVSAIRDHEFSVPGIEEFTGSQKTIVVGSTWPADEQVLQKLTGFFIQHSLKLIIAPHEVSQKRIAELQEQFKGAVLYSSLHLKESQNSSVLIIDNIGMLSKLYKYSYVSYVGGGFMKMGVHNVLEPAVFGTPVIMGPYYKKYYEASGLIKAGGAFSVKNENEMEDILTQLAQNRTLYEKAGKAAGDFVASHAGATKKIVDYIQENRLLTN